jgi:uncharacterized protein
VNDWIVDVARLRRDHRGRRTVKGALHVVDLELPAAQVPTGMVEHTFDVDATGADVIVTGQVRFDWRAECRRCLEPVNGSGEVELREVFQFAPVEGETWPVVDDEVDLEPMVREAVLLALPATAVCRDDCTGPSSDYVVTVAAEPINEEIEESIDPRWAALDDLEFD